MPLRIRRNHYQPLTGFERSRTIGLRKGPFSFHDIAETWSECIYCVGLLVRVVPGRHYLKKTGVMPRTGHH
ncbi:hypothetical protein TNCV_1663981 [Trichonephila clavipes]|uniref:Uncharacterized protein n=1 Tax=Trichonephila clavipes TaxID=2585209 RepID=A0A8X6RSR6_TRICX|nr:hypothetical protein TNCV_1663981 [Trichonephila clavipes]